MLTYILQAQSARYRKSVSLGQSALHLTGKVRRNSRRANKWSAVVWTKLSTTGWADSIIIIFLATYSSQLYHTFWNKVSVWGLVSSFIDGVDTTRRDATNGARGHLWLGWGSPGIGETVASRLTLAEDFYMPNLVSMLRCLYVNIREYFQLYSLIINC